MDNEEEEHDEGNDFVHQEQNIVLMIWTYSKGVNMQSHIGGGGINSLGKSGQEISQGHTLCYPHTQINTWSWCSRGRVNIRSLVPGYCETSLH